AACVRSTCVCPSDGITIAPSIPRIATTTRTSTSVYARLRMACSALRPSGLGNRTVLLIEPPGPDLPGGAVVDPAGLFLVRLVRDRAARRLDQRLRLTRQIRVPGRALEIEPVPRDDRPPQI